MKTEKTTKRLNIEIPIDTHCEIKIRSARRNIMMQTYVIRAILEQFRKEDQYDAKRENDASK